MRRGFDVAERYQQKIGIQLRCLSIILIEIKGTVAERVFCSATDFLLNSGNRRIISAHQH